MLVSAYLPGDVALHNTISSMLVSTYYYM
jgi:hypothetical protein